MTAPVRCLGTLGKLPDFGALIGKSMGKKVDECAHFGLRKAARWVDSIDALRLNRQVRDRHFHQTILHRFGVKKAGQIGDAKPANTSVQQRLPIVDGQPARCPHLTLFTGRGGQFPNG